MRPNLVRTIFKVFYWMLIAMILGVGCMLLPPSFSRYYKLQKRRQSYIERNQKQEELLGKTLRNQLRFKEDPEFVERIARRNRQVRPGELVFIFDETER